MAENKNKSLQALRGIAFIGIFLLHAGSSYFEWSMQGVSVFFVLSGFLLAIKYNADELDFSIRGSFRFSFSRIKKIYPLHILTMLAVALLNFAALIVKYDMAVSKIHELILKLVLNITLLQSWYPNALINFSLNGVAWYLSTLCFLYFLFPILQKKIEKISPRKRIIVGFLILIIQILASIPMANRIEGYDPIYVWFCQCFPIFRIGDLYWGIILGNYYKENKSVEAKKWNINLIETIALVATIAISLWIKNSETNMITAGIKNNTTLYILMAVIWVYLFANSKGIITKALSNKVFIWLGDISSYLFLIHYVVTSYFGSLQSFIGEEFQGVKLVVLICIEFILSVICSLIYRKLQIGKFIHKRELNS